MTRLAGDGRKSELIGMDTPQSFSGRNGILHGIDERGVPKLHSSGTGTRRFSFAVVWSTLLQ